MLSPFLFTSTSPTEIYTLSLHDALPIFRLCLTKIRPASLFSKRIHRKPPNFRSQGPSRWDHENENLAVFYVSSSDRKSTRLNSSHPSISYAVFCLKKKTNQT